MEAISAYLKRATVKDYQEGVLLYNTYGDNPHFKRQLACSRPISFFPYLKSELKKLLKSASRYKPTYAVPPIPTEASSPTVANVDEKAIKPLAGKAKTEYEKVVEYRKKQYIEFAKLRNGLADIATDGKRALAAEKILQLKMENDELWEELDYYDKNGHWLAGYPLAEKEEANKPKPSTARLKQDLKNVQGRIRRMKKKLALIKAELGEESPKYVKALQAFNELQFEEINIKEQLKK